MLTNGSLVIGCLINLLFVPAIGAKIYCNRHENAKELFIYMLITVLNYPFTKILAIIIQKFVPLTFYVEEAKFTFIALISCIALPFIMECVEKLFHVEIAISLRPANKIYKKSKKVEEADEK